MEVTGLVLGVLPILISALEHYDDVLQPFIRYKNFSSRLRDYNDELQVHRTIFRTECIILLGTTTTKDAAVAMLNDLNHQSWNDVDLEARLDRQLGSLRAACASTIQRINKKIEEILIKSKEFDAIAVPSSVTDPKTRTDWKNIVSKKLKFSIRSDRTIQKSLEELSRLNSVFRILSSQITQLELQWQPIDKRPNSQEQLANDVKDIQAIREASISLHESLSRLCTKHDNHVAQFCLDAAYRSWPSQPTNYCVQFDLRWLGPGKHLKESNDITRDTQQLRQSVRASIIVDAMEPIVRKADIRLDIESVPQGSTSYSAVASDEASSSMSPPPDGRVPSSLPDETNDLADFCAGSGITMEDNRLLTLSESVKSEQKSLSTILMGQAGLYQHHVRASCGTDLLHSFRHNDESRNLATLLSLTTKTGRQAQLPQLLRLYLAKVLSNASLQYHNTPWLPGFLQSDVIVFTQPVHSSTLTRACCIPFVEVSLEKDKIQSTVEKSTSMQPEVHSGGSNFPTVIPNDTLFHLGILLLELAYNWPFASLVSEVRDDASILISSALDEKTTDYLIAQYLAEDVGTKMGATYASIVKKCLRCDFGSGNNLDQLDMQKSVYNQVLCKLEELEAGIRKPQNQEVTAVQTS